MNAALLNQIRKKKSYIRKKGIVEMIEITLA